MRPVNRNDWLDVCCAHMARPKNGYTLDDCIKEAKKYSTKLEWQTASKSTYHKALNMGWVRKCCCYMKKRKTKSRRSNVTGIKGLSIGTTKNKKGNILTRYTVNFSGGNRTFYFGHNQSQSEAFLKAVSLMIEKGMTDLGIDDARKIYKRYKHEKLAKTLPKN